MNGREPNFLTCHKKLGDSFSVLSMNSSIFAIPLGEKSNKSWSNQSSTNSITAFIV